MKILKSFSLVITLSFFLISCGGDSISLVQNGSFDSCEGITVGEMVNDYFADPSWEAIVADDDRTYVNVTGGITFAEEPATALLQFKIRDDQFMVNALEINGEGMEEFVILLMIEDMCSEAF